ncbi:hypothetical protein E3V36_05580 [Candidatus Marinimicrobia bacterium MT.SAG.2]|nr:hypothetical protein E3V36_05580 [Candidatus Marinimicrobia bacterium MT.SAG.2]
MKIKPTIKLSLVLTSFILMVNACSDSSTNGSNNLAECNSDLILSVSDGTTPTFTWEPECRAALLYVQDKDSSRIEDMWRIFSGGNNIPSSIQYGILPDSVYVVDGPTTLVSGTQYELIVYWRLSPGEDIENFEGPFTRVFIP